ncbi:MAG: SpaH/EbpB family LPXTG-anchored major pilin [Acutalibacteraceae bacterium]|nr:SpaH/EbpB family LPXTG-anchored major pilin [Acutalibacteraceae bacterium]
MKTNKLFKKLIAFFMTAALAVGCFSITASADAVELDESKVTIADTEYYKGIIGKNAPETANINIGKFVEATDVDGNVIADTNNPVKDVVFSTVKIGDIFQVEDGTTTLMTYGITKTLADKIAENGKTIEADYTVTVDGTEYVLVKDYQKINTALMGTYPEYYKEIINRAVSEKTGEDGYARFSGMEYGLYLVVESSVANAQTKNANGEWDWITITRKQAPYVVSAPIYDDTNKTWLAEINATAKNVTGTADIDKKIVRSYDGTLGYADGEVLNDTDVTNVNDVVEFKFISKVPDLTDSKDNTAIDIDKYVITDAISKGLTLPETFSDANIVITDKNNVSYTFGRDYTVAKGVDVGTEGYKGGSTFSITFTPDGLAKLTNLAKAMSDGEVYVYYTATVNSNAVVGVKGNPNKVKLTFQAGQSHEIDTQWDEVKEFIFGMEANKQFDGVTDNIKAADVTFELYADADCTQAITVTTVADGNYIYASTDTTGTVTASTLKLDGSSKLYIKGVPTGVDLYLKETATSTGYNKLQNPVKVKLVPAKGGDGEYTGVLAILANTSTVNGTAATLVRDDTAVTLAVNNTSGFQLPATGGMGAWIFAILGVLVIGGGVTFYVITRKKRA